MRKINWIHITLVLFLSLVLATIIEIVAIKITGKSSLVSLGKAWIIVLISVFLMYWFVVLRDKKIEKNELIVMLFIAALLFLMGWIMRKFIPEIFTSLPNPMRSLFSALGGP